MKNIKIILLILFIITIFVHTNDNIMKNLNLVTCNNKEFKTEFKVGDRVEVPEYCGVLVLDSVDEFTTKATGKLNWNTTSESYLLGKSKTNNGEVYSDSELKFTDL